MHSVRTPYEHTRYLHVLACVRIMYFVLRVGRSVGGVIKARKPPGNPPSCFLISFIYCTDGCFAQLCRDVFNRTVQLYGHTAFLRYSLLKSQRNIQLASGIETCWPKR